MKFFLRIKAWLLFLILVILPIFTSSGSIFEQVMLVFWLGCYIGWIYTIGIFMHDILDVKLKPGVKYFQFNCLFLVVVEIFLVFWGRFEINQDNFQQYGSSIWVLIPVIFYLFWCVMYIFMFAAQMLHSVKERRLVSRSDSLKVFFGFWFFPIGVWYIQCEVQQIMIDLTEGENFLLDENV